MLGVDIDIVVKDSLKALELYEKIFEIERMEVTNFPRGQNEVIFNLYGVRFHLLDENQDFHLIALTEEDPKTIWVNVIVPSIKDTDIRKIGVEIEEVQQVSEQADYELANAIVMDAIGHIWMLYN